jgi:hypothetical protein
MMPGKLSIHPVIVASIRPETALFAIVGDCETFYAKAKHPRIA